MLQDGLGNLIRLHPAGISQMVPAGKAWRSLFMAGITVLTQHLGTQVLRSHFPFTSGTSCGRLGGASLFLSFIHSNINT